MSRYVLANQMTMTVSNWVIATSFRRESGLLQKGKKKDKQVVVFLSQSIEIKSDVFRQSDWTRNSRALQPTSFMLPMTHTPYQRPFGKDMPYRRVKQSIRPKKRIMVINKTKKDIETNTKSPSVIRKPTRCIASD